MMLKPLLLREIGGGQLGNETRDQWEVSGGGGSGEGHL